MTATDLTCEIRRLPSPAWGGVGGGGRPCKAPLPEVNNPYTPTSNRLISCGNQNLSTVDTLPIAKDIPA